MSLASRLIDLATAVGADIKTIALSSNAPSYAPRGLKNSYDPRNNVYNLKGSNTKHAHAGIAKALNGGKMNILTFGDSLFIGYDGNSGTCLEWRSIPRLVGRLMAQSLGVPEAGGMIPATAAQYVIETDKVSLTGTVIVDQGMATMYAGSTMTMRSDNAGTVVEFYYSDLSSAFTLSLDGAAAVNITPGGTSAMKRYQWTGVADIPHTIVVSAPTNWVFWSVFAVHRPAGIAVHNIAWGGSRAAVGGPGVAWLDATGTANLPVMRKGAFDLMSVVPDLVILSIGGNDIPSGATADSIATAITTLRGWYPNSDWMLVVSQGLTTTNQATWDAFCGRMYTLADTLDMTLLDVRDRVGFATEAITNGLIGPDGYHEIQGAMFDWARLIANAYTGSGAGQLASTPQGVYIPLTMVAGGFTPTGCAAPAARLEGGDIVRLRGAFGGIVYTGGSYGQAGGGTFTPPTTPLTTFPVGMRPSSRRVLRSMGSTGTPALDIVVETDGTMWPIGSLAGGALVNFDGATFSL